MDRSDVDLISAIYDAVAEPARWTETLDRVVEHVGGVGAVVIDLTPDGESRVGPFNHLSSYYDPEILREYHNRYDDTERKIHRYIGANTTAFDTLEILDNQDYRSSVEAVEYQKRADFLRRGGIGEVVAVMLDKDNRDQSRLTIAFDPDHGPLIGEARRRLQAIIPHIAKATNLTRPFASLTTKRGELAAMLDALGIGVCILDRDGRVVIANGEFRRQEEAYDAFRVDPSGRIAFGREEDHKRLAALVADALAHGRFGGRPRKEAITTDDGPNGTGGLCIDIAPLAHLDALGASPFAGAALFSIDTARPPTVDLAPLSRIFGLTAAEAELANLMCDGLTNVQIAERRERARATVDAQVKSLLAKTQAANRTQFVRMAMNFGADFLRLENPRP